MINLYGNIDRPSLLAPEEWYEGLCTRIFTEHQPKELWVLQTSHHTGEAFTTKDIAVEPEYKSKNIKAFLVPPGDGLVVTKQEVAERSAAIIMITADCPTVLLQHADSDRIALLHCSRDALYRNEEVGKYSVIDNAMEHFRDEGTVKVTAQSYCGIQSHFFHATDQPEYETKYKKQIMSFKEDCKGVGLAAIRGSEDTNDLDLQNIITCQLVSHSVPSQNIIHDKIDTYTDQNYASHRREGKSRTKSNAVVYTAD